ncbi:MAG: hypothetical protein J4G10_05930, partial [Alphaproteobacteria bacterium]|nr:hypothetical protein [Alphaproteobacteria bacterium]
GYYLDYAVGTISYTALFLCLGVGFQESLLGEWSLVLGLTGAASAFAATFVVIGIDHHNGGIAMGYPSFAGFELQDGIYLIVPIAWFGWLMPFFAAASIATSCYLLWTTWLLLQERRQNAGYRANLRSSHVPRVSGSANKQRQ